MGDALPWALMIDLTFHVQWPTSRVRCQPPCSGSFACLKKPSWSCQSHWCHSWSCTVEVPSMFFQAVLVIWNIWAQIFTQNLAAQESKLWDRYHGLKGSWTEEVQSKRVKLRSCRKTHVFQGDPALCRGRWKMPCLGSWSLIWHVMANGILLKFDVSHHAVVLLVFKIILVLRIALVPLLNLQQGSKIVLPGLVDYLAPLSPNFYIKSGCPRITTLGQLSWSKMVLHRDCAVQNSGAAKL